MGMPGRERWFHIHDRDRVRRMLLEDWDPIGIGHEPVTQDEYDAYADRAYEMLLDGASADQVAAYLYRIASHDMGFGPDPRIQPDCQHVADELVALKIQSNPS